MDNPAPNDYPVHELLRRRWSPLAFAARPVSPETLARIFEAARWAPSCYNEQPWAFILATRQQSEDFDRLAGCLVEANRTWAAKAPVLLLATAKKTFARNGVENRHAWYDLGQAMALLTVQATAEGLFVHQMAGFDPDRARKTCHIPDTHQPAVMAAVGYYGDPAELPEALRKRESAPRQRHPLKQMVFSGTWGRPAEFTTTISTT